MRHSLSAMRTGVAGQAGRVAATIDNADAAASAILACAWCGRSGVSRSPPSVQLHLGLSDHLAPHRAICIDEGRELGRRVAA